MKYAGCQYFVFFYLNIEGWKVSAEQQLQAIELDFLKTGNSEKQVGGSTNFIQLFSQVIQLMLHISQGGYLDSMREAALSIYQEYLSDKVAIFHSS